METLTWQLFAQVAGIGGLALGVFLVLFRDIIRKKIFPRLSPADGYRLLRLITLCVWSVAIVGIGAWVLLQMDSKGIEQHTEGDNSPAISGIRGDVSISTTTPGKSQ